MAIEKQEFKQILGSFAAGVTIITTTASDGTRYGLTATAFTSVSLEPPLILVCVDKRSESHAALLSAGKFAVSFLSAEQQDLSNRFAKSGGDKFAGLAVQTGTSGVPYLEGVVAWLDCATWQTVDAGDHTIFIGLVEAGSTAAVEPLLYFRGGYRRLG